MNDSVMVVAMTALFMAFWFVLWSVGIYRADPKGWNLTRRQTVFRGLFFVVLSTAVLLVCAWVMAGYAKGLLWFFLGKRLDP